MKVLVFVCLLAAVCNAITVSRTLRSFARAGEITGKVKYSTVGQVCGKSGDTTFLCGGDTDGKDSICKAASGKETGTCEYYDMKKGQDTCKGNTNRLKYLNAAKQFADTNFPKKNTDLDPKLTGGLLKSEWTIGFDDQIVGLPGSVKGHLWSGAMGYWAEYIVKWLFVNSYQQDPQYVAEQGFLGVTGNPKDNICEHPVYASINLCGWPFGATKTYGESVIVLKDSVKSRATITFHDTGYLHGTAQEELIQGEPNDPFFGGKKEFKGKIITGYDGNLAPVLTAVNKMSDQDARKAFKLNMLAGKCDAWKNASDRQSQSANYFEAHIFGGVRWDTDVAEIRISTKQVPAGSVTEKNLLRFANFFKIPVKYHDMEKVYDTRPGSQTQKSKKQQTPKKI